jgi:hypothetical protein
MEARAGPYDPTTDSIGGDRTGIVTMFKRAERDVRKFELVVRSIGL